MNRTRIPAAASGITAALIAASLLFAAAPVQSAGIYYVDNSSGSCSDLGPGTEASPYCTISAAVLAHHGTGTTILVKPGTYREQVTVPLAGSAGSPLIFQALGGPVVVDGADDFSSTSAWTPYSGDVYLAAGVTWAPNQVFLDGARLDPSTSDPAFLPARSFEWVSGQGLYVNVEGGNPGAHSLLVGHRPYGFLAAARTYLVIDGFNVTRAENRGIQLNNACTNVAVSRDTVTFCDRYGIQAVGGSSIAIDSNLVSDNGDHGIMLLSGVTASVVQSNESFRNAQATGHAANGIYLFGCTSNLIQNNRAHDNQDTGIQIDSGSNDCQVIQNVSWNNGDHGYDNINATGTSLVGNDAFGNYSDGFSIDGASTGVQLADCIAANNGLTSNQSDLWVDATSAASFTSDYNIFWNSTTQTPIKYIATTYVSVPAYSAATGQDAHSIQVDPGFMNPWAGDFRLVTGSVAIDDANSAVPNWPPTDAAGLARVDDPATSNLGAGPVPYADRGALEYQASHIVIPPVASMTITPPVGAEPLLVSADASGSHDPDGTIATYRFDFGDGTVVGPQASPIATHTYAAGNWTASLIVTDNDGAARAASVLVAVTASSPMNLALNSSFEGTLDGWDPFGASALAVVPGGLVGDDALQMTGTGGTLASFGVNDHANWVHSVPASGQQYRFSTWVMSPSNTGNAEVSVSEYVLATGELVNSAASARVRLSPGWQPVTMLYIASRQGTTLDFHIRDFPVALGEIFMADSVSIFDLGLTSTAVGPGNPASLAPLFYPSPLRTTSVLRFSTARSGRLTVEILDLAGRRVRRLMDDPQAAAGIHQLSVSRSGGAGGPALGPGVYFYRITAGDGRRSGRFVVLQ